MESDIKLMDGWLAAYADVGSVANVAGKYDKPVIAFAGMIKNEDLLVGHGIAEMYSVTPESMTLSEAMKPETAKMNLATKAEQVFKKKIHG